MFIAILTLLSALSISGVAIFYSVIGLATIFPGAFWPVVIMGSVLEVGKLITASWLYRQWKFTPFLLKTYLTIAVVLLSIITSMGIFGFLSKAHLEQNLASDTLVQRVDIINDKIESQTIYIERQKAIITRSEKAIDRVGKDFTQDIAVQENIINSAYARLEVLDADVKAYTDQGRGLFKGDNIKKGVELRKQQKPERDQLSAEIEEAKALIQKYRDQSRQGGDNNKAQIKEAENNIIVAQNKIDDLIIERQPLEKKLINLEAEVGPVKYIAALAVDWGMAEEVNLSKAVRWVILLIIVVFDPLAVLLLIAANQSFARRFPPTPPKPQEIVDLEKPDEEDVTLKWNEMIAKANEQVTKEKEKKLKMQVTDWQSKLEKFNKKAPKPVDKPVEIVVDQPKPEPTKQEKIDAFEERMKAEEAELERVAAETKADIERIKKSNEDYKFEDEIKYDVETEVKEQPIEFDEERQDIVAQNGNDGLHYEEDPGIAEQIEEVMEDQKSRIKPDLTEVIEPAKPKTFKKGMLGGVNSPVYTHAEKKKMLEAQDKDNLGTDSEHKEERDTHNVYKFLKESPVTEEEAKAHPPITKSRMAFFEDHIDDIKRGNVSAEQLPPEVRKTVSVLLSEYDNPQIEEPKPEPKPKPTVKTMTTEGLVETFKQDPEIEDRDITDAELDALLAGDDEAEPKEGFDIIIQGGRKIKVPKTSYKQNSEQEKSNAWSKIKELDLPEPEKNEIILPKFENEAEPEQIEADEFKVEKILPKEKIQTHKKRLINDEQYRQRIESRINDLIIKIETGEIKLEDLTPEDQNVIISLMKEQGNNG
jgi:hypothetical protein